jgi:predicted AAA+ superfamily ATPase
LNNEIYANIIHAMKNRGISSWLTARLSAQQRRLIVLTGARQTGKTTLVRHLFPNHAYISFDDPVVRPQLQSLSANDWIIRYPAAILDEVQKAPSLFDTVKAIYDQAPHTHLILLGSSQILLMENVRESLAGRASILELFPLTLPELVSVSWETPLTPSRLINFLTDPSHDTRMLEGIPAMSPAYALATLQWERFLAMGGMPALWQSDTPDISLSRDWLRDYVRTYLQRDIRDLVAMRDLEPFVLAQRALAAQTGGLLNASDLARASGISPSTALRFIRYLEISYQALSIPPWFRNRSKRLAKTPKLHILDPGITRAILGKWESLSGNEFESAVVTEIHKQIKTWNVDATLHHLRTTDGREVDLLIELEKGYIPIEIKQASTVSRHDARHLADLDTILDKPVIAALVLSNDPVPRPITPGVLALPAPWFLSGNANS